MGTVENSEIKGKSEAYQEFFDKRTDGRTMNNGLDEEVKTSEQFGDNLTAKEKRYIDSINYLKDQSRLANAGKQARNQQRYYSQDERRRQEDRKRDDDQYDRSMKMLEALNGDKNKQANSRPQAEPVREKNVQEDQMSLMRSQMMLMDSIEKSNNPALKGQAEANERLKQNEDDLKMFLNSTLKVSKSQQSQDFNSIRIRLLEDIYVGTLKIKKGNFLYALISGFALQRVNLNVVSVMYQNEILPINLNIYDVDGMEGLYVPASAFREMTRKMGQSAVQGNSLNLQNSDFFTNALSSLFQSTSQTVAALVRKNKVSVKYNSFIYLVDNKELQKRKQNIYKPTEE
ncbi:MAG: conjugative transposon protein TraM [Rickettsiaceae bacterium]|nr:MAG: conjugative transposon protein TraM [Rickettsiaceae bacterium]